MTRFRDERTGMTWELRPHSEVEGAVDLVCTVSDGGLPHWRMECVPLDVLTELLVEANALQEMKTR
jgi:hypothetical protein